MERIDEETIWLVERAVSSMTADPEEVREFLEEHGVRVTDCFSSVDDLIAMIKGRGISDKIPYVLSVIAAAIMRSESPDYRGAKVTLEIEDEQGRKWVLECEVRPVIRIRGPRSSLNLPENADPDTILRLVSQLR